MYSWYPSFNHLLYPHLSVVTCSPVLTRRSSLSWRPRQWWQKRIDAARPGSWQAAGAAVWSPGGSGSDPRTPDGSPGRSQSRTSPRLETDTNTSNVFWVCCDLYFTNSLTLFVKMILKQKLKTMITLMIIFAPNVLIKLTWLSLDVWVLLLKLLFLFVQLLLEVLKFLLVLVLLFFRNLRFRWGLQWDRQKKKKPSVNSIECCA